MLYHDRIHWFSVKMMLFKRQIEYATKSSPSIQVLLDTLPLRSLISKVDIPDTKYAADIQKRESEYNKVSSEYSMVMRSSTAVYNS